MKRIALSFLCITLIMISGCSKGDTPIQVNDLPQNAQQFIKQHFPNLNVSYAMKDNDSYDVVFTNGYKVEFDKKGNWQEVDCNVDAIPTAIIPAAIRTYVQQNYANSLIVQIDKDRHGYSIELNNGLDLDFDSDGKFRRIDD